MKKLLLTSVALTALFGGSAVAADLRVRAPAIAYRRPISSLGPAATSAGMSGTADQATISKFSSMMSIQRRSKPSPTVCRPRAWSAAYRADVTIKPDLSCMASRATTAG